MHYILFYELADDYIERRAEFRSKHLALAWQASERGELVLGGVLEEPIDTALLLFEAESADAAKRFAEADPYVLNGLVKSWHVRPWTTVAGDRAAKPTRAVPGKSTSR
jgi:uncharacterized protein YciI